MENLSAVQSLEVEGSSDGKVVERSSVKRYFLLALLVSTWIPFVFFIVLAPSDAGSGNVSAIKSLFLFLGTAHVPATLYLYRDPEFSGIIKNHKFRYIYAPILLAIVTGLLFVFLSRPSQAFILLVCLAGLPLWSPKHRAIRLRLHSADWKIAPQDGEVGNQPRHYSGNSGHLQDTR